MHFSNAYIDLSWAWIIDHLATRNFLKQYLTTAPINKIFVFGGDYLSVEPTVVHAYVARLGIAQVLTELVNENYFAESDAIAIAFHLKVCRRSIATALQIPIRTIREVFSRQIQYLL